MAAAKSKTTAAASKAKATTKTTKSAPAAKTATKKTAAATKKTASSAPASPSKTPKKSASVAAVSPKAAVSSAKKNASPSPAKKSAGKIQNEDLKGAGEICVNCNQNDSGNICLLPCRHWICQMCLLDVFNLTDVCGQSGVCPTCAAKLIGFQRYTQAEMQQRIDDEEDDDNNNNSNQSSQNSQQPSQFSQMAKSASSSSTTAASTATTTATTATKGTAPPGSPLNDPNQPSQEELAKKVSGVFCWKHDNSCSIQTSASRRRPHYRCSHPSKRACVLCWACDKNKGNMGVPHCDCNKPCILVMSFTTKNPNRVFYTCARELGEPCKTFAWAMKRTAPRASYW